MKKLTLGTALVSLLALTACGETDTREKHRYTVEVEVTDPNGKIQKISKECNQLFNLCQARFDLENPLGKRTISVMATNKPVHEEELYKKSQSVNSREEEARLTDSEYRQTVMIKGFGFHNSIKQTRFKDVDFQPTNWAPRTERVIQQELMVPNPDLEKKVIELEMKIKEVRAERPKNRKETHENLERLRKLENERHSGVCLRNSKREVILKSNNT